MPKLLNKQIKLQKGKVDGDVDMCVFFGDDVPRCDRALVMHAFCSTRQRTDLTTLKPTWDDSFIDELEKRGYDLDTLRFSIDKKAI